MVNMSAKFDEDAHKGSVSIMFTRSKHEIDRHTRTQTDKQNYSDDSFIQTRLFPVNISKLTSFPDYWIANKSGRGIRFPHFLSGLARFPNYRSPD